MSKVSRKGKARASRPRSRLDAATRNLESIQNIPIDHRSVSIIFMDGMKNKLGLPEDAFVSSDLIQISRGLSLQRTCEIVAWGMCILWTRYIKWNIGEDYDKPISSAFYIGECQHDIVLSRCSLEKPLRHHYGNSYQHATHTFSSTSATDAIRQVAETVSWEWNRWRNEMARDALRFLAMSPDDRLASINQSGLKMMYAAFAQERYERKEKEPVSAAAA